LCFITENRIWIRNFVKITANTQIYALLQYNIRLRILKILDAKRNFLSPKYDFTKPTSDFSHQPLFSEDHCLNSDKNEAFLLFGESFLLIAECFYSPLSILNTKTTLLYPLPSPKESFECCKHRFYSVSGFFLAPLFVNLALRSS